MIGQKVPPSIWVQATPWLTPPLPLNCHVDLWKSKLMVITLKYVHYSNMSADGSPKRVAKGLRQSTHLIWMDLKTDLGSLLLDCCLDDKAAETTL